MEKKRELRERLAFSEFVIDTVHRIMNWRSLGPGLFTYEEGILELRIYYYEQREGNL